VDQFAGWSRWLAASIGALTLRLGGFLSLNTIAWGISIYFRSAMSRASAEHRHGRFPPMRSERCRDLVAPITI
jgi:hypothetical protein